MEMLIGLAVIGLYSWVLYRCGLKADVAPVTVLCCTMLYFMLAGALNVLIPAGVIFYAASPVAVFLCSRMRKNTTEQECFFSAGTIAFFGASVFVMVLFAVRQPVFSSWDDYSYWGLARMVTKNSDTIYCIAESRLKGTCVGSATIMLDYFFQFLSAEFCEWKSLVSMDILLFSCLAALVGPMRREHKKTAGLVLLLGFFLTFFLTNYIVYAHTKNQSAGYMSLSLDIPVGMMGAVPVLIWLSQKDSVNKCRWACMAVLLCLPMVKDVGMAFGMIVGVLILVLEIMENWGQLRTKRKDLCAAGFMVVCSPLAYGLWVGYWTLWRSKHLQLAQSSAAVGKADPLDSSILGALRQLLQPSMRTEKGVTVFSEMVRSFFEVRICYLGTPAILCVLLLAVTVAVIVMAKNRRDRLQFVLSGIILTMGCVAYQVFLSLCYIGIFNEAEGKGLASYNRYVYAYFLLWTLILLGMTGCVVIRKELLKESALLFGVLCCLIFFGRYITLERSFLHYQAKDMERYKTFKESAEELYEVLPEDRRTRLFVVDQGDSGFHWLQYDYELWPKVELESKYSGLTIVADSGGTSYMVPYSVISAEELEEVLDESSDYVYVRYADWPFCRDYGSLFEDGFVGNRFLYRVDRTEDGILLVPEKEFVG